MNVLHITPSTNGYREVELVANAVNRKNNLTVIRENGELFYTGGYILNDTKEIRDVLDSIPCEKQFDFIKSFKNDPFVKSYLEE